MRYLYTTRHTGLGALIGPDPLENLTNKEKSALFELYAREKAWFEISSCEGGHIPDPLFGTRPSARNVELSNKLIVPIAEFHRELPRDWWKLDDNNMTAIERGLDPAAIPYLYDDLKRARGGGFETYILKFLVQLLLLFLQFYKLTSQKMMGNTLSLFR